MKRRRQMPPLLDQNGIRTVPEQYGRRLSNVANDRRSYEDCLESAGCGPFHEFRRWLDGPDGAAGLPAVSIALDRQIHPAETVLSRRHDFLRHENRAGAGAHHRVTLGELHERAEEPLVLEQFQHRGGFPAGNDEPVKITQFSLLADIHGLVPELLDDPAMGLEVALQRENAHLY